MGNADLVRLVQTCESHQVLRLDASGLRRLSGPDSCQYARYPSLACQTYPSRPASSHDRVDMLPNPRLSSVMSRSVALAAISAMF